MKEETVVDLIKDDIIATLSKEIALQVSNYVSAKINYYFKESHVSKGNNLKQFATNYEKFSNEVKINEWYDIRKIEIEDIVRTKDYQKLLSVFNNKGLKTIANKHLKISDFIDRAIRLIQYESQTHDILLAHFPKELKQNKILL